MINLRNGLCILGLLSLSVLLTHFLTAESLLFFPPSLCVMVVFLLLEWPPKHLLVDLVWGNISKLYMTHMNSITMRQQEELSFQ